MADAEYRDRAVYLPAADALVCADLHVGRDATSNVAFPLGERADLTGRLGRLLDAFEPSEVVFAGDVLHAFDRVPDEACETLDALAELVADAGARLVVTPGNHDARLDRRFDATTPEYRLADGDTVVCHGHEAPAGDATRYVVGHDHPAIVIEGRKYPCALAGPDAYAGSDVFVLPAFTRLAGGTSVNDMMATDFQSPLLAEGAGLAGYRPLVWDPETSETLRFPPLGEVGPYL